MEPIFPRKEQLPSFAAGQTACHSSKHLAACERQLLSQPALQHPLDVGAASLGETHKAAASAEEYTPSPPKCVTPITDKGIYVIKCQLALDTPSQTAVKWDSCNLRKQ